MRLLLIILAVVLLFGWSKDHNEMQATSDDARMQCDQWKSALGILATTRHAEEQVKSADLQTRLEKEHANCETLVAAAANLTKDKAALIDNYNEAAAEVKRLKAEPHSCPKPICTEAEYKALLAEVERLKNPPKAAPKRDTRIVKWQTSLAAAERLADELDRPVYIAFSKDPCPYCEVLKRDVYEADKPAHVLCGEFVPVWLEWPTNADEMRDFNVHSFPYAAIERGKDYRKFDPERTTGAFLKQLEREKDRP